MLGSQLEAAHSNIGDWTADIVPSKLHYPTC